MSGTKWSPILWNCPFTIALHKLVCSDPLSDAPEQYYDSVIAKELPIIGLLLADIDDLEDPTNSTHFTTLREILVPFLSRALHAQLQQYWDDDRNLQRAMTQLIDAQKKETISCVYKALSHSLSDKHNKGSRGIPKRISLVMTLGISPGLMAHERRVLQSLVQWLISWSLAEGGASVSDIVWGAQLVFEAMKTELDKDASGASVNDNLEWLYYILSQLRSVLTVTIDGVERIRDQKLLEPIANMMIELVHFLQRFDSDHSSRSHRLHNPEYSHGGKTCSSLCHFSSAIIYFVHLIRDELPSYARLDTELWRNLETSLGVRSADLGAEYSSARWHRDTVKRKILVTFQALAPEDESK